MFRTLLPTAYVVWEKVMLSRASVCLQGVLFKGVVWPEGGGGRGGGGGKEDHRPPRRYGQCAVVIYFC